MNEKALDKWGLLFKKEFAPKGVSFFLSKK